MMTLINELQLLLTILNSALIYASLRKSTGIWICTNQKPWITKQIQEIIDHKQDAHKSGNWKLYNELKALERHEIRQGKLLS